MLNLKRVLLAVIAVGSLVCTYSVPARAQFMNDASRKMWTNKPCQDPEISWALAAEIRGTPSGGIDCNPSNYPNFRTFRTDGQMMQALADYRALMRRQSATVSPLFVAGNGHTLQTISKNGVPVFDVDYGKILGNSSSGVVGPAGGSLIGDSGATIVATGAGNLVSHDGGSIVATGAGNFYGGLSVGDTVVQFPGKWVKVSKVAAAPPQPARPAAIQPAARPSAPAGRDDNILLCVSPTVNQIRRNDNGANHVSLGVAGGVARFSGNVLNQSYKDTLSRQATACGATPDISSLRVGR
jgi:hypothetical protein